jgi:DNA-binding transcriptional LysR family regulator
MNVLASFRYLVSLSEHRHFGRAAEACHITQPALSNALRALETEYGVVIVKRARQFSGFTEEGEQVLASARRMLHEHALLTEQLKSEVDQPRGALRIGVVPTAIPVATRFAVHLRQTYPGIQPVVLSLSSQAIELGLEQLTLDLGLGYLDRAGRGLQCAHQYDEHYFLVSGCPEPGPRAAAEWGPPMSWSEAAQLPLCLLTPEMHNRSLVDDAFRQAGVAPVPVLETNAVSALSVGVLAGKMATILPGALVATLIQQPGLRVQPLVNPGLATPVGWLSLKSEQAGRVVSAALRLSQDPQWLAQLAAFSGSLNG